MQFSLPNALRLYLPEPNLDLVFCTGAAALSAFSLLTGQRGSSGNHWLLFLPITAREQGMGRAALCMPKDTQRVAWDHSSSFL